MHRPRSTPTAKSRRKFLPAFQQRSASFRWACSLSQQAACRLWPDDLPHKIRCAWHAPFGWILLKNRLISTALLVQGNLHATERPRNSNPLVHAALSRPTALRQRVHMIYMSRKKVTCCTSGIGPLWFASEAICSFFLTDATAVSCCANHKRSSRFSRFIWLIVGPAQSTTTIPIEAYANELSKCRSAGYLSCSVHELRLRPGCRA